MARSDDGVVSEWPEAAVSEGSGAGEPDRAAFLAFYQEAVPEVYGYFLHRCGDSTTAEDLTSETFLAAVRSLEGGRPAPLDVPWVIGVARHKLADHWRGRARENRLRDALEQDPAPDTVISSAPLAVADVGASVTPAASPAATRMRSLIRFLRHPMYTGGGASGSRAEIACRPVGDRRLRAMMGL